MPSMLVHQLRSGARVHCGLADATPSPITVVINCVALSGRFHLRKALTVRQMDRLGLLVRLNILHHSVGAL